MKSFLALVFLACGLTSTASAAFAAGHADRKGMFCIDVNALSARLQDVEDRYDAISPTDSARLYSTWKKLDGSYGDVSPIMTNLSEQYGTKDDFAPEHELEKCDDDTRLAMAKAQARYQVISLGFQHPLSFDQERLGDGPRYFLYMPI